MNIEKYYKKPTIKYLKIFDKAKYICYYLITK